MINESANFERHKMAKHDGEQVDSCPTCVYLSGQYRIPEKEVVESVEQPVEVA